MTGFKTFSYDLPIDMNQNFWQDLTQHLSRDHSGYWLSQWEVTLRCNVVSHRLSPYPEWSLSQCFKRCALLWMEASVNWVIVSGIGLVGVQHQAITWTNTLLPLIGPQQTNCVRDCIQDWECNAIKGCILIWEYIIFSTWTALLTHWPLGNLNEILGT